MKFGEAFGAIAALQQEGAALGDFGEIGLERARFARKHERRMRFEGGGRSLERGLVEIVGQMPCLVSLPAIGCPIGRHGIFRLRRREWRLIARL